ncbi:MAG: fumarylacetoacetate hydrolase family protein [Rhodospirillaceae bacterium]|jgi:2-keto-4-pentenoate hydratase/2-oxohepta-3-ene-1,7-dioic acid hydratase in catechol pathway|nr:fumarylacetoacetate hydrolase family protein [Rhodospirillaceae bacterium]MBT4588859.1 fumarylacetoacetate hydrolase family protein [Rhodospirillaceae bacterium]MBT4938959.1 fumarylacetoacetate hydrolase family protein [Rhodospirillaceae bacterium]
MRVISYQKDGKSGVGVVIGDNDVIALSDVAPELPGSLKAILEVDPGLDKVRAASDGKAPSFLMDDVLLDPVIPEPIAIWAMALNFHTHVEETGLTTSDKFPHIFLRHAGGHVGSGQPLMCPDPEIARAYDYEGEMAIIIGKSGRHIPKDKALDHIAGFSVYNEGSVREFQGHNRQFGLGKNFEKSASFGPWLMTPDEFGDPYVQSIRTSLNGVVRQDECLDGSIFRMDELIHYISTGYKLRAGDVIVCGTPGAKKPDANDKAAQVDAHFDDAVQYAGRVHMTPGDICEVEITGLGTLSNPVEADIPPVYTIY